MFGKRIAALAAAIVLSLSVCMTSLAAMSLDDYDETMYDTVKQLIEEEVDEDIRDTELEILEAIRTEATSQGSSLANQKEGTKLIKKVAKDKSLWAAQWIAAFQKACDQYGVSSLEISGNIDTAADDNAVNKLHILQWDEDPSGVNRSAMKLMIDRIMANTALTNVMGICMAFAASLCIAFGIGDILQQATEKSASTEALWRSFLKMCCGLFIIYNCLYIAAVIIYTGDVILTAALNATTGAGAADTEAYRTHMALWLSVTSIEKSGGFSLLAKTAGSGNAGVFATAFNAAITSIGNAMPGVFAGLAVATGGIGGVLIALITKFAGSGIISFVISLTVYAIAIDIGVRFVFTPLAVADLFSERFRSTGIKWMKSLAAAALQGVIIYVIVIVGTQLREILESGALIPGFSPVTSCIINLTMLGLFVKSGNIAREVIGTH